MWVLLFDLREKVIDDFLHSVIYLTIDGEKMCPRMPFDYERVLLLSAPDPFDESLPNACSSLFLLAYKKNIAQIDIPEK